MRPTGGPAGIAAGAMSWGAPAATPAAPGSAEGAPRNSACARRRLLTPREAVLRAVPLAHDRHEPRPALVGRGHEREAQPRQQRRLGPAEPLGRLGPEP